VILEGIVTTLSLDGVLNIAPMGPRIDPDLSMARFVLRPYMQLRRACVLDFTRARDTGLDFPIYIKSNKYFININIINIARKPPN
jgi:hypothetical protein